MVDSPVCQDDDDGLAAADAVGATPAAPRDDGDDGGDDDVDGDAGSRRRLVRAVAADDDEDDATPSPGHRPVLRLSGRAPLTRCSYSRSLSTTKFHRLEIRNTLVQIFISTNVTKIRERTKYVSSFECYYFHFVRKHFTYIFIRYFGEFFFFFLRNKISHSRKTRSLV